MKPVKFDIHGVEALVGGVAVVIGAPEPVLRLVTMPNGRYKLLISKELLPETYIHAERPIEIERVQTDEKTSESERASSSQNQLPSNPKEMNASTTK